MPERVKDFLTAVTLALIVFGICLLLSFMSEIKNTVALQAQLATCNQTQIKEQTDTQLNEIMDNYIKHLSIMDGYQQGVKDATANITIPEPIIKTVIVTENITVEKEIVKEIRIPLDYNPCPFKSLQELTEWVNNWKSRVIVWGVMKDGSLCEGYAIAMMIDMVNDGKLGFPQIALLPSGGHVCVVVPVFNENKFYFIEPQKKTITDIYLDCYWKIN